MLVLICLFLQGVEPSYFTGLRSDKGLMKCKWTLCVDYRKWSQYQVVPMFDKTLGVVYFWSEHTILDNICLPLYLQTDQQDFRNIDVKTKDACMAKAIEIGRDEFTPSSTCDSTFRSEVKQLFIHYYMNYGSFNHKTL